MKQVLSYEEEGFVVVLEPQLSVRRFLDELGKEHLEGTDTVIKLNVPSEGNEFFALLGRESFFSDLLKGFRGDPELEHPPGTPSRTKIDDHRWSSVLRQFGLDLPRENFLVDGLCYTDMHDAMEAIKTHIKRVHTEICERTKQSFSLMHFIYSMASSWLWNPSHVQEPCLDEAAKLVVLLSQQSVLAIPYEILHRQYAALDDRELMLGEIAQMRDWTRNAALKPPNLPNAMSVHLQSPVAGKSQLTISKKFRLFTIVDSEPVTLFVVDASLRVDLFSTDDVELRWVLSEAEDDSDLRRRELDAQGKTRDCDCLGARSGFHQSSCKRSEKRPAHCRQNGKHK